MQVLTALELARQARIAANRAFLAGLQLAPQAMATGQVTLLALPCFYLATYQLSTDRWQLARPVANRRKTGLIAV